MNDDGILGGALNQLGQTVKKTAQQVVKIPQEMVQDVGGQVDGAPQRPGSEGQAKPAEKKQQWQSDEERVKFLRDLYGSNSGEESLKDKDKSPEEQKKLLELRQQLHKEVYYDPTFNPVKNPPGGGEERPAEKVENEKKEEMQELQQKKAEKPPPLAVVRERNKAETFRGASG